MKITLKASIKPRTERSLDGLETLVVKTMIESGKARIDDPDPIFTEEITVPAKNAEEICNLINEKP
jgi:hypothetical protein